MKARATHPLRASCHTRGFAALPVEPCQVGSTICAICGICGCILTPVTPNWTGTLYRYTV